MKNENQKVYTDKDTAIEEFQNFFTKPNLTKLPNPHSQSYCAEVCLNRTCRYLEFHDPAWRFGSDQKKICWD